ncbi:MAG TPA: serine/threonine protein kinase, partial [Limnobacter sp.]|nr:serine/threonine protein kinase [Limnobacter sp.]
MNQEKTVVLKRPPAAPASSEGPSGGPQPLAPGKPLGDFEIRKVIGVGGFGIVYSAWDPALERLVALKEYFPATLARRNSQGVVELLDTRHAGTYAAGLASFVNEARLLARFDHHA